VVPYALIVQAKACDTEGSYGEMRGMKLLGGLEYVLLLREVFICEVIMVMAASPVMHRCPAIMTRDCKSPPGSGPLTGSSVRSVSAKYRFAECLSSNSASWVCLAVEGACRDKRS
jgi:hypothetical protein